MEKLPSIISVEKKIALALVKNDTLKLVQLSNMTEKLKLSVSTYNIALEIKKLRNIENTPYCD